MEPGALLRAARRRNGLSQAELAARAGTSQPVISAYERGRRDPTYGTLRRLVEATGERLHIEARVPVSDVPPPADLEEHARRLLDVLSLADAVPRRRPSAVLTGQADLGVTRRSLAQRILDIDRVLDTIPHAFGGALALAYYAEPRATIDIAVNVFVPVERFPEVAGPLSTLGVSVDEAAAELVRRHGQARVMWQHTPIDLFFGYDPFHEAAAGARLVVPFADATIPILAAEHLLVCKAVFNRPQDWVDIDAMLAHDAQVDVAEVLRWAGRIAGDDDPRFERLALVLTRR